MEKVNVAIIGAGSAGLSALRRVKMQTDNYVLIDHEPLGTKCARTGCMPSKTLIHAANDYSRHRVYENEGIRGSQSLSPDIPAVLSYVRKIRDHFSEQMVNATQDLVGDHFFAGKAEIIAPDQIRVNNMTFRVDHLIIATGSAATVPSAWHQFGDRILTSETFFEQNDLPPRIGIIGLGPIGLEIGQALSRLGLAITGFDLHGHIGALTDPAVNETAVGIIKNEFPIFLHTAAELEESENALQIKAGDRETEVDAVIAAMGVTPNLKGFGLENLGLQLDHNGVPPFNPHTMQVADLPIFIAGDANHYRPILHEALDEGFIAGQNSTSAGICSYCRRPLLYVIFSDPQIAVVGEDYERLNNNHRSFLVGQASFDAQSRAVIEHRNKGLIRLYIDSHSAQLLGAEMMCPEAEHLAHHLAIAIQHRLTIFDMLAVPFYHPTIEEALRTAFQDAAGQFTEAPAYRDTSLSLCKSCPESPLR